MRGGKRCIRHEPAQDVRGHPGDIVVTRALELLLTPRRLSAPEAREWGLIATVVPDGSARGSAEKLAAELAAGSAWALGQTRALVRGAWASDRSTVGHTEATTIARACATPESAALLERFAKR
ncbi:hypothetical protein PV396_42355 [Streptomyces sp. ME02-8801-2C]|uniref:enoyl-CoA hydratase/isomerase family protein n=1 Tax=Streptomyces sp. ME02-8801-2C TaxID=3028680 RepID=UPI0029AEFF3C|nr:hypothetical protein [Streptomyces sp. ME02-8801-2C]MDX3458508.1 hypothetical protein [Streptomyces sp. ME02-8801-2C]